MKKISLLLVVLAAIFICSPTGIYAQGVGINSSGNTANPSAGLDVDYTNKGVLISRISLQSITDVTTIPSPATSLLVYNTNASITGGSGAGFYYWDGTKWSPVAGSSSGSACSSAPATPGTISGNSAVCTGGIGTFFTLPVTGATSYTWTYTGTGTTVSGTGNLVSLSFSSSATSGNLSVTASNTCGTSSSSANFAITVNQTPNSNFTYTPSTVNLYTSVNFTASDQSNQLYFWSFTGGTYSTNPNPSFTWPILGADVVTLSATKGGCSSSSSQTLSNPMPGHGTQTYQYTGAVQQFIVPQTGVTSVALDARGAQASCCPVANGPGGRAAGTLTVSPGEVLYLYVGSGSAMWNGGGHSGAPGGDASDVRVGGTALTNRILVAGGGGGAGYNGGSNWAIAGGAGGGTTGGAGTSNGSIGAGGGGGQSNGGTGGTGGNSNGNAGSLGQGGGNPGGCNNAGGGGGGYYGGGAAALNSSNCFGAGGGGGSNYIDPSLGSPISTQGYWTGGDGQIIITW